MKRIVAILIMSTAILTAFAFPVRITSWDIKADVKLLNSMHISVDNVDARNGSIIAYAFDEAEFQKILGAGFNAVRMPDPAVELAARLNQIKGDVPPTKDEYYNNDQYNAFMIQTAVQYPDICSLTLAGYSIQNRPIYFLKISDNVSTDETEPEFKYVSSIHGDEVLGYDMLIRLIQLLTSEYGTTARITNIVNNTEIWICPMMNPDGFVLGQRYNSAGVDLNRNFPMPSGNQHPDGNDWAQENVVMMNFSNAHNFVLSANFHGGALVMNYPWDYTYALAPDNDLLIQASLAFAHPYSAMYNSSEFPQGITNGAAWYVITGSMQDWIYGFTGGTDITAEIGYNKWPPASNLPGYWNQMKESYLAYLEFVQRGVHGTVTSASGTPLEATLTVQGNSKLIHSSAGQGDYHRMLLPGTYTITASATGYIPQSATITVPAGGSTTHDFVLQTAGMATLSGIVRNLDGIGQAQLTVALGTNPPATVNTDASGAFSFGTLYEGSYLLTVSDANGTYYKRPIHLSSDSPHASIILPPSMIYDTFDSGMQNFTGTGGWGIGTVSGDPALTDSPTGNYPNNVNSWSSLTPPLNLTNIQDPVIGFRTRYFLENGYDFAYLEASANGTDWTQIASFTGSQSTYTYLAYPLTAFAGATCHLRFRLQSDSGVTMNGIYIDNLRIFGYADNATVYGDVDGSWTVDKADAKAIVEYSVGLDPIPAIDPLPWSAYRIAAADVDSDSQVCAYDAHQILRYAQDSGFRFLAQTGGEPPNAPDPGMTITYLEGIRIGFANPSSVWSVDMRIQPLTGVQVSDPLWNPAQQNGVKAFNPLTHSIAWAGIDDALNSVLLPVLTDLNSVQCVYDINGNAGNQQVSLGSPNDDPQVLPATLMLDGNYPNPFNPSTTIRYAIPTDGEARLEIYNTRGQLVTKLVDASLPAGWHSVLWDGRDANGKPVASGVYLYRLQHAAGSISRKMLLNK